MLKTTAVVAVVFAIGGCSASVEQSDRRPSGAAGVDAPALVAAGGGGGSSPVIEQLSADTLTVDGKRYVLTDGTASQADRAIYARTKDAYAKGATTADVPIGDLAMLLRPVVGWNGKRYISEEPDLRAAADVQNGLGAASWPAHEPMSPPSPSRAPFVAAPKPKRGRRRRVEPAVALRSQ